MPFWNTLAAVIAAGCFLENTSVVLAGRRMNREKPVRTNGEARPRMASVPVLTLALPICVREYSSGFERRDIRELRLAADNKQVFRDMKVLLNAQVDAEGTVQLDQTPSGGLDVFLNVRSIRRRVSREQARR